MPVPYVGRAARSRGSPARRAPANTGTGQSPGTGAGGTPATSGVFGGGAGEFFQDFKSDFAGTFAALQSGGVADGFQLWGDGWRAQHNPAGNGGTGTVLLTKASPSPGLGLMTLPSFSGDKSQGFPNGMFEFRARFTSDTGTNGDGSGPALVIWPGSNIWPGPEIDIGEINWLGDVYYATHWRDANGQNQYQSYDLKDAPWWDLPQTFYRDFHTFGGFLQTDRITYYLDGKQIGVETAHPAPDLAHGGENHAFGFMNRSSGTTCECDWMRWTPEATMLGKAASGGTGGGSTGGGSSGGGTAAAGASQDLIGPNGAAAGGSPGAFGLQLQGQSNAVFFYENQLPTNGQGNSWVRDVFNQVIQQLTDLGGPQVFLDGNIPASLAGGTGTYKFDANDLVWLRGYDQNHSNPMGWPNNQQMADFLNWAGSAAGNVPAGRPVALIRMHTEYDSALTGSEEPGAYEAVSREFIRRWRDRVGRGVSLTPVFIAQVPYLNAKNAMVNAMRTAWRNMCADASLNCYMASGNQSDVGSRDDQAFGGSGFFSHWDSEGSARVARRIAIRIARWMHDNGYSARNLDGIPTLGPRIGSFSRVPGQADKLDLSILHDKGTDLVVPAGFNPDEWEVYNDGQRKAVTGVAKQNASTVRLTLGSGLSANPVTLDYCRGPWYFDEVSNQHPNSTIYDNWHTLAKPVSNGELDKARMPLQRLRAPLAEGTTSTGGGTGTGGGTTGGGTVARSFAFSPQNPGSRSAGVWNTTLTATGMSSVSWVVQNGASMNWSWESNPTQVAVPQNGQVPIAANLIRSEQFVLVFDTNDSAFQAYSGQVTIV